MAIVQDIVVCPGCGQEVELLTDGRTAYVSSCSEQGDTTEVWRDGFALVAACPVVLDPELPETCGERVVFTGEGPVLVEGRDIHGYDGFSAPILSNEP